MPLTGIHFPHLFVRAGCPSTAPSGAHGAFLLCGTGNSLLCSLFPFVDRYRAQNCPGNSENINIINNSPTDVEVQFFFENDEEAETFLLDPPSMTLKPEEKQVGEGQVEQAPWKCPGAAPPAHTQCSFYFFPWGRVQELTIWAYPTSPGFLEDKTICYIGKNPDPVVFSLCCQGVHVKLEVSPLELSFDKLHLHGSVIPQALQDL